MEISDSIIIKYKLVPTDNHIGEAIIHNLLVFKSDLLGFESVVFMECDFHGRPSDYITLFNSRAKKHISVMPEYLEAMAIVDILKFVV